MRTLAILLVMAAACRSHIDPFVPDATGAGSLLDAMPDVPTLLPCGVSQRMTIDNTLASNITQLSAAGTPRGYDVFAVTADGQVHGFAYDLAGDQLKPNLSDLPVAADASGPLGPLALGDDLLLATPYATGTALMPLDSQLGPTGPRTSLEGWAGAAGALARNSDGAIAFLFQQRVKEGEVDVKLVSPSGTDAGTTKVIATMAEAAETPTIVAAGSRFLALWGAPKTTPHEVHARLLDGQLTASPPVTLSVETQLDSFTPRAAYLASADRFLIAWTEKNDGVDQIWISLRDGDLILKSAPVKVSTQGRFPVVIAGDQEFLVVWQVDAGGPTGKGPTLSAIRVTKDGDVIHPGITNTGGAAIGWDLVVRDGQPALVWLEGGGTGQNLWIDPLCN